MYKFFSPLLTARGKGGIEGYPWPSLKALTAPWNRTLQLPAHFATVCLLFCLLLFPLMGCGLLPSVSVDGTPVISPTNSTSGGIALNVWHKAASGVEIRYEDWKSPGPDEDIVTIVRFDVHDVHLSIGYSPNSPLLLSQWMQKTHATAIINGGYFDQQDNATALVVSNGQTFGRSYNGFGGMFSVDMQGHISLRSLQEQPYDPINEQLQQATQSSPMLVLPGGKRAEFNADASSARRSIVAMDKQGRLLLIASPNAAFSLDELADLLLKSDLSINTALNLDGGNSTGLFLNTGSSHISIDSIAKLPIVILIKVA